MYEPLFLLVVVFVTWVIPCLIFPAVAGDRGQDGTRTLLLCFVLGWIGGILSLVFLPVDPSKIESSEVSAPPTSPPHPSMRSEEARERIYRELMGGKRKG